MHKGHDGTQLALLVLLGTQLGPCRSSIQRLCNSPLCYAARCYDGPPPSPLPKGYYNETCPSGNQCCEPGYTCINVDDGHLCVAPGFAYCESAPAKYMVDGGTCCEAGTGPSEGFCAGVRAHAPSTFC